MGRHRRRKDEINIRIQKGIKVVIVKNIRQYGNMEGMILSYLITAMKIIYSVMIPKHFSHEKTIAFIFTK